MNILGIAGKAGSGKDTVADWLVANHGYVKLSMAGPLKAGLAAMGFPEPANRDDKEKQIEGFNFTWRDAAQKLGTEWGRALDQEIWLKCIEQLCGQHERVVISDIRFDNEAAMVRRLGGKMLFLAGREADLGSASGHASEKGVTCMPSIDGLIDNGGGFLDTTHQIESYLGMQA